MTRKYSFNVEESSKGLEEQKMKIKDKYNHINNIIKYEWTKHPITKAEIVKLSLK